MPFDDLIFGVGLVSEAAQRVSFRYRILAAALFFDVPLERMASNRYVIEYAKTGRSGCKNTKCKGNVTRDPHPPLVN